MLRTAAVKEVSAVEKEKRIKDSSIHLSSYEGIHRFVRNPIILTNRFILRGEDEHIRGIEAI